MDLCCTLRERRDAAGLSQAELARRVGITRQSLLAIESGRHVPSTAIALRLAAALACRVEDLFRFGPPDALTVRLADAIGSDPARVALGRVDGRLVAHALPADAMTSADAIVHPAPAGRSSTARASPLHDVAELDDHVLVAGCAPVLGVLAPRLARRGSATRLRWLPHTSGRALACLREGLVHVAGLHLHDARTGEDNAPFVRRRFRGERMSLVHLVRWRQGLVVGAGNPRKIQRIADLARPRVRVASRDPEAGAARLLRRLLAAEGIAAIPSGPRIDGHHQVAQAVALGAVDVGVAIEPVAIALGLGFIPLAEERFDLVLPTARADEPAIARLLAAIDDPSFRRELSHLPGYDASQTGHVHRLDPDPEAT